MTEETNAPGPDRQRIRALVAGLTEGSGLRVQELDHELIISNARLPERGKVHVEFDSGYVSWERVTWDYWGELPGFGGGRDDLVTADRIREALIA